MTSSKDPCWKYSTVDPNDRNTVICNFCGKQTKGGIFRAKKHLTGGFRDVKKCPRCPASVREEIASFMRKKAKDKEEIMMPGWSNNVDDYGYDEYDEGEDIERGDGVLSKKLKGLVRTGSSEGPMDELAKKDLRQEVVEKCAIWFYTAGIPIDTVEAPSFQDAWDALCRFSMVPFDLKPPSAYELWGPLLQNEKRKINDIMTSHKEEWEKYGCTLILDGWHDEESKKDILNVMVSSSKGMVFLMSKDVSARVNDAQKLSLLLGKLIEHITEEKVVHVVTDNASTYAAAGKLLENQRRHLFWSPCATHCIDLMLEDIGKIPRIRGAIKKAVFLNSYLYNHSGVSNLMKKYTGKRELLRSSVTRFATTFITFKSLYEQKRKLRRMFVSDDWIKKKWYKEAEGKKCVRIVLMESFWRDIVYALKLTIPLVKVLALVYSDKPSMGHIYGAIDRAKEVIMKSFNHNEEKYKEAFEIIDNRWQCQLHQPLHSAGYYLNPSIFYDNRQAILENCDIMNGLQQCIGRLVRSQEEQDAINVELPKYQNAESIFGNGIVTRASKIRSPVEWWEQFGDVVPHLKKFAISILSLTCSATRHEKNWDIFQQLHSKRIDLLTQSRLRKLLFVRYNLSLIDQHKCQNEIDPLLLINTDESNEWLVGVMDDDGEDLAGDTFYLNQSNVLTGNDEEEAFVDGETDEEGEDRFDLDLHIFSDDEDDSQDEYD